MLAISPPILKAQNVPASRAWLSRFLSVEPSEIRPLLWAAAYFFFILFSYYLIHPIRNAYGATKEVQKYLSWLFTINMLIVLLLNPIYGSLISRFSRRRFIPWAYYFFLGSLVLFFGALLVFDEKTGGFVSLGFYVWASVFNLFIISIFWDFMVDIFNSDQGKRLFSFISVVGNLGALLASIIVELFTHSIRSIYLIPVSALMLFLATLCGKRLHRISGQIPQKQLSAEAAERPPGQGSFSFVRTVFQSRYLLGICAYTTILIVSGTFIYLKQSQLLAAQNLESNSSTRYFARADFLTNLLVILLQVFLAGRVLKKLGITRTLILMPILILAGLSFIYLFPASRTIFSTYSPQLLFIMGLQILSRALEFSIVKPARKVLFTVLSRDEKYSAQSFIDTFVHRGADVLTAWMKTALEKSGLDIIHVGLGMTPLWIFWVYLSIFLGNRYKKQNPTPDKTCPQ